MRRASTIATTSWVAVAALAAAGGCSDSDTLVGDAPPTEVAVDPLEFLGDVPCSADPGAAKSYVAMLTDTNTGFTYAAAPPASCASRMAFRLVTVGNVYTAEIDVYDVPVAELLPAGGAASGSRVMLDASGAVVPPRWRSRCGQGPSGGAVAVASTSVVVAGCTPLDAGGTATTGILVDPNLALPDVADGEDAGDLACSSAGGVVETIAILPSGPASGAPLPPVTLACGDTIVFDEGLVTGASYTFRLEAREAEGISARWATTCTAVVTDGVQRTAACAPFTSSGTISVTPTTFDLPDFACGAAYDAYDVALEGPAVVSVPRTACTSETLVSPLPPGSYSGTLRTYADGVLSRTATCEALVSPAATTSLDCTFD